MNNFNVDILCFKEEESDDQFSAVAVNMDIWGYGDDPKQAVDSCMESVIAQITFSLQSDDLSLLDFPADKKYMAMFKECRLQELKWRFVKDAVEKAKAGAKTVFAYERPLPDELPSQDFAHA